MTHITIQNDLYSKTVSVTVVNEFVTKHICPKRQRCSRPRHDSCYYWNIRGGVMRRKKCGRIVIVMILRILAHSLIRGGLWTKTITPHGHLPCSIAIHNYAIMQRKITLPWFCFQVKNGYAPTGLNYYTIQLNPNREFFKGPSLFLPSSKVIL